MLNGATFVYRPKLRCYSMQGGSKRLPCGRLAYWMRSSALPHDVMFLCDACREAGDVPVAEDAPFRRVTLMLEIHLAGASRSVGAAHTEAVTRAEEALQSLGGMVTVASVTSQVGRLAGRDVRPGAPRKKGRV